MATSFYNPELRILDGGLVPLKGRWDYAAICTPYWRFYWNSKPGAFVHFRGKKYPLLPENFTLIPPNTLFSTSCTGAPLQLCIHFHATAPYARLEPEIFTFPLTVRGGLLKKILREILPLAKEPPLESRQYAMLMMQILLAALAELPEEKLLSPSMDPRIRTAMETLENTVHPPSNQTLAHQAHMSTNAFVRLFREHTGQSPQQYNKGCRIEKACLQLHYSQLDIKEIAGQVGFCDRYHFSRIFKKWRGVSPAKFRSHETGKG